MQDKRCFEEEQDLLQDLLQNLDPWPHVNPTNYGEVRYLGQAKSDDWFIGLSFRLETIKLIWVIPTPTARSIRT